MVGVEVGTTRRKYLTCEEIVMDVLIEVVLNLIVQYGWLALHALLVVSGLFCTLIGLLTVIHWMKAPKAPSDESNRINNIMSWWIGLTRPEVMGKAYKAFRQDVMDNINDIE